MAALLSDAEIKAKLSQLGGWQQAGSTLQSTKVFDGFPAAIAFLNQLIEPAEAAGHHPDLTVSYNKVTVSLTTHDAGGLTQKDFDLAAQINRLAS